MDRLKLECKKIAEQIEPSEEFMANLKDTLKDKLDEKQKQKTHLKQVAAVFLAITLLSTGVFAKGIGDFMSKLFSNTDKSMQIAVENGYIQNVNMDYVESNGVKIKVNSIMIDDNIMDVVFDVKTEEEYKNIILSEFCIIDENGNEIYSMVKQDKSSDVNNFYYSSDFKVVSKTNYLVHTKLSMLKKLYEANDQLYINIEMIGLNTKQDEKLVKGNWEIPLQIEDNMLKNQDVKLAEYTVTNSEDIKDYKIYATRMGLKVELYFREEMIDLNDLSLLKRENVYIEDENNQRYYYNDNMSFISKQFVLFDFPIEKIDKFTLIMILEDKELRWNIEKTNG